MKKKLPYIIFLFALSICSLLLYCGTKSVVSESLNKSEKFEKRSLFISGIEYFKELKRPPVAFNHDMHTAALEKDGCKSCHLQDKKNQNRFIFSFPKDLNKKDLKTMDSKDLMDSYHNTCLGCHEKRSTLGKSHGALACGDCHVVHEFKHVERAALDEKYYQNLKDTYHKDCISCHKKGEKPSKKADSLDWKSFYMKVTKRDASDLPKPLFGYARHHNHEKNMNKKCESCHHIYNKKLDKLEYRKGTESSCRDCHRKTDIVKDKKIVRSFRKSFHADCLNCHMERKQMSKKAGPFYCGQCHKDWKEKTPEEIKTIPRPFRNQPSMAYINVNDARMNGVSFNHKAHEGTTLTCRSCHHDKLAACKDCHTMKGDKEKGKNVTLAQAYHKLTSSRSCIGCHESKKKEKSCAGCHSSLKGGLVKSSCVTCHSGPGGIGTTSKIGSPAALLPGGIPAEMKIAFIEKDYENAIFPHRKIIQKLSDISNKSKLAKAFHTDRMTMCNGCHHKSNMSPGKKAPLCISCHNSLRDKKTNNTPDLLGAYHRQCLGCHKSMKLKTKKKECLACHAKKNKKAMTGIKKEQ